MGSSTDGEDSARDAFFAQMPLESRSLIGQITHCAAAAGARTPEQIATLVRQDAIRRRSSPWSDDGDRDFAELVLTLLTEQRDLCLDYFHFVLKYEQLPAESRRLLKVQRGEQYRRGWMERQRPSE